MADNQQITLRPSDGGALATNVPADVIGPANYTTKRNWRRDFREEVTREGHVQFYPNQTIPLGNQNQPAGGFETDVDVVQFGEVRQPDGKRAVLAFTPTAVYRYFALDEGDVYAKEPPEGALGDDADPANYPVFYQDPPAGASPPDDDPANYPVYDDNPGEWIQIASGLTPSPYRWQIENIGGVAILNNGVDLPLAYRVNDFVAHPLVQMREQGIASVRRIASYNEFLIAKDVTEIRSDHFADIMNGADPYGPVTSPQLTVNTQYRIVWPEPGDPTDWAAPAAGSIQEGSNVFELDYPVSSFRVGQSVAVFGAGEGGGLLLGTIQFASETSDTIILDVFAAETTEDTQLIREESLSAFTGRFDLEDDGTRINVGLQLGDLFVLYRDRSIFVMSFTGSFQEPFRFQRVYQGPNTPEFPNSVQTINGKFHAYPAQETFWGFDLSSRQPREIPSLKLCADLLFESRTGEPEEVWAVDNSVTKEIWWVFPSSHEHVKAICYDYLESTVSTTDVEILAALSIRRPRAVSPQEPQDWWFVMSLKAPQGEIVQYGLTKTGGATYQRLGASYEAVLTSGDIAFGDHLNEKKVRSYTLHGNGAVAGTPQVAITLRDVAETVADRHVVWSYQDMADAPSQMLDKQAYYFRDSITTTVNGSATFLHGRTFLLAPITSRSHNRDNPQAATAGTGEP